MPIYEYRCDRCDHEFEEWARTMSGRARPACPECGERKATRKQSVFAAHQTSAPASPLPMNGCGRSECGAGGCPMME